MVFAGTKRFVSNFEARNWMVYFCLESQERVPSRKDTPMLGRVVSWKLAKHCLACAAARRFFCNNCAMLVNVGWWFMRLICRSTVSALNIWVCHREPTKWLEVFLVNLSALWGHFWVPRLLPLAILGVPSPFFPGIRIFSGSHQKPNSRFLKRTMVEKNRESTPRFVPESIRRYPVGPSMFGKPSCLNQPVEL